MNVLCAESEPHQVKSSQRAELMELQRSDVCSSVPTGGAVLAEGRRSARERSILQSSLFLSCMLIAGGERFRNICPGCTAPTRPPPTDLAALRLLESSFLSPEADEIQFLCHKS